MKIGNKKDKVSRLLATEEEEARRIASELHHDLAQSLSTIKTDLEKVVREIKTDQIDTGIKDIEGVMHKIQEIIKRVQGIGMHLWPPTLNHIGILATISWLCREFQDSHSGIQIKTDIDIQENDIPGFLKYVIYKILQEALNNIAKSAKADLVDLFLSKGDTTIELTIRDNGRGFDMEREALMSSRLSLSLDSMKERIKIAGGSCAIESVMGKGTVIRASLPIDP